MTEDDLRKYLTDIFMNAEVQQEYEKEYPPIGRIDLANGTYLYHIGNGVYTGDKGWEQFNQALAEEAKKYLDTKE